jgi:hypothetical protein
MKIPDKTLIAVLVRGVIRLIILLSIPNIRMYMSNGIKAISNKMLAKANNLKLILKPFLIAF